MSKSKAHLVLPIIKSILEPLGFKPKYEEYENINSLISVTCPEGHVTQDTWEHYRKRSKITKNICMLCSGKSKQLTLEETYNLMKEKCEIYNIKVISPLSEWKGRKHNVEIECPSGHKEITTFDSFDQRGDNAKCQTCVRGGPRKNNKLEARALFEKVKEEFVKLNIILITEEINRCNDTIKYKCEKGHLNEKIFNEWPKIICDTCIKRNEFMCQLLGSCKHIDKRRKNANKENVFDLDYEWIQKQAELQEMKCYYSRLTMITENNSLYSMSIDRLNNDIGHMKTNCVLVIAPVNFCKNVFHHEEFINWIKEVSSITENTNINDDIVGIQTRCKTARRIDKYSNRNPCLCENDVIELIKNNNNRCAITNIPLRWSSKCLNSGSLDRIDNNKGHTIDNIQPTLYKINMMKNVNYSNDDVKLVWNALVQNTKK